MKRFSQKRALITGGGTGIGRAIALALAAEDGHATIVGPDPEALAEVAGFSPGLLHAEECDLRDLPRWKKILMDHADLDILINNAAISVPTDALNPEDSSWSDVFAVNFEAARIGCLEAARHMQNRGGRIVNVTSVHGTLCERNSAAYGVAKAALNQLTRSLAVEFARFGILVNAVAPGFVDTPMSRASGVNELETDYFRSTFLDNGRLPIARAAQPEEIARAVLFLADPANSYITGHILVADGGLSLTL